MSQRGPISQLLECELDQEIRQHGIVLMLDAGGIIPACPAHGLPPTSWSRSHAEPGCDTAVAYHTAHVLFLLAAAPHHPQVLETPGMLGIVMQGARPDSYQGAIIVNVEPSRDFHPGVHFLVNDHYETTGKEQGCGEATETLAARWVDSMAMSVGIMHTLREDTG